MTERLICALPDAFALGERESKQFGAVPVTEIPWVSTSATLFDVTFKFEHATEVSGSDISIAIPCFAVSSAVV